MTHEIDEWWHFSSRSKYVSSRHWLRQQTLTVVAFVLVTTEHPRVAAAERTSSRGGRRGGAACRHAHRLWSREGPSSSTFHYSNLKKRRLQIKNPRLFNRIRIEPDLGSGPAPQIWPPLTFSLLGKGAGAGTPNAMGSCAGGASIMGLWGGLGRERTNAQEVEDDGCCFRYEYHCLRVPPPRPGLPHRQRLLAPRG
jgi:hypothetical protein